MSPAWLRHAGGHGKGIYSEKGNWGHIIGEIGHEGRMEAQHVQMPTDGSTWEARGQEWFYSHRVSVWQGQMKGFPSSQWPSLSFSLFRMPSMLPILQYSLFHSPTCCNSCPSRHLINKNVLVPVSLSALLAPYVGPWREGKEPIFYSRNVYLHTHCPLCDSVLKVCHFWCHKPSLSYIWDDLANQSTAARTAAGPGRPGEALPSVCGSHLLLWWL